MSPFRLWVRKRVPKRVRHLFVWLVDRLAWRDREPGAHHRGGTQ